MRIRSVLVLTDFSAHAAPVVTRAAGIAARHQARLRLAYLAGADDSRLADRLARLSLYGRQIARRHAIPVTDHQRSVHTPADLVALTERADLLVLAPSLERRFAGARFGRLLPSALSQGHCAVLIARNPGLVHYARSLQSSMTDGQRPDCRPDDLLIVETAPVSLIDRLLGRHPAVALIERLPCDLLLLPDGRPVGARPASRPGAERRYAAAGLGLADALAEGGAR